MLNEEIAWLREAPSTFLHAAVNDGRFSWHVGDRFSRQSRALDNARAKVLHVLMAPVAAWARRRDCAA